MSIMRDEVLSELKGLEGADGKLHAAHVVDAARSPASPLHALFTWDDATAAEERRLEQARGLIRSYRVAIVTTTASGGQRAVMTRQYVSDHLLGLDSPPGTYTAITSLTPQGQELRRLRMHRELSALVRRYEDLNEFWTELAVRLNAHRKAEREAG